MKQNKEYMSIIIVPYALPNFLYACRCSGIRRLTMTAEDNDLVARFDMDEIRDMVYPNKGTPVNSINLNSGETANETN